MTSPRTALTIAASVLLAACGGSRSKGPKLPPPEYEIEAPISDAATLSPEEKQLPAPPDGGTRAAL